MATTAQQDRLAVLQAGIAEQAARLVTSDGWQEWLTTARQFHNYSFSNTLLIKWQAPDATLVAGFQRWKQLGRTVNKGEKAIWITAPVTSRWAADPARPEDTRRLAKGEQPAPGEQVSTRVVNVKPVAVFDISQTSGEPLPGWDTSHGSVMEGEAPAGLWEKLAGMIEKQGFTVHRGDCGEADGVTDYGERTVTISPNVTGAQAVSTLAHELGHVLMHHPGDQNMRGNTGWLGVAEVEAESVAFLVLAGAGMDSACCTTPYVAGWAETAASQQHSEVGEIIKNTASRVLKTANQIIDEIMPDQPDPLGKSIAHQIGTFQPPAPGTPNPQPEPALGPAINGMTAAIETSQPDPAGKPVTRPTGAFQPPAPDTPNPQPPADGGRWRAGQWQIQGPDGLRDVWIATPAGQPEPCTLREAACRAAGIGDTKTEAITAADTTMTSQTDAHLRQQTRRQQTILQTIPEPAPQPPQPGPAPDLAAAQPTLGF